MSAPLNHKSRSSAHQPAKDKGFRPSGTFVGSPIEDVETSISDRFEQIVRRYPDRLAVKTGDRGITYDELNKAANRIAHAILETRGPGSEPVALLFESGVDIIAAIFGVLKAGKFFLALDPAFPEQRNFRALEDSGAPFIVTDLRHGVRANALWLVPSLQIETLGTTCATNPALQHEVGDIAALTYTSGSTGRPKGVILTHEHLLHSFRIQTDEMKVSIDDRISLLHSLNFSTAYSNLLAALLNGAALFPLDMKAVGPCEFARWVVDHRITVLHLPPTSVRQFAESMPAKEQLQQLRLIRLSGAPITQRDFELYKSCFPASTLLNITMGSTEIRGICSALLDHTYSFPTEGAPVGYSRPGKEVLILDDLGREVDSDHEGEIAVRSNFAAAHYWQPRLLGKKPTSQTPGADRERIFRTGDRGKKSDDGFVIHLGRMDFMAKIRGYRVEVTEIEKTLLSYPMIQHAGVVARDDGAGDKYLAAYIVSRQKPGPTVDLIRQFLRNKVPDYMIPSTFTYMDALPLTNGKLDRNALPPPERRRPRLSAEWVGPGSDTEKRLAQIWRQTLDIDGIGIHDNFFDLGGHSLAATRVGAQISQQFQVEIPLRSFFESPTVAQSAAAIDSATIEKLNSDKLDRLMSEIEAMSEEEARQLVAAKNTGCAKA
jgi:amino acid adenylation domain-containing protein